MAVTANQTDPNVHVSLAEALAAFHLERPRVVKDSDNPHFGNRYASLDAFEAAVLPLLAKHGLTWMCLPSTDEDGAGLHVMWRLVHASSGESIEGIWPLVSGNSQATGSSLTYAKRYLLSAVTGVSADDDDNGEAATAAVTRRLQREADEQRDWSRVLEIANETPSLPDLRTLYVAQGVKRAPKDVQAAFQERVDEVKSTESVATE